VSNRLSKEKSLYLLQHQNNPVDWYPWGDEAFEKAKAENKPIFLSIGYATCHWCHVMEHESFKDQNIANMMNKAFISIKVDREERPDIDATYMTVCQLINGQGGWPLSIIMNAAKEPFFAATYIPKQARFNRIGMRQLIPGIDGMWNNEPERIQKAIAQIKKGFKQSQEFTKGKFPGTEAIDFAAEQLIKSYDSMNGGFGGVPKFPSPHNLMFLLRQYNFTKKQRFLDAVEHTLTKMRLGGIWDHVGFGFHRYSTDSEWLLPHFEKMLYDQALLMMTYTEAWQLTKNPLFKQTVDEIAEYVSRDLMHPEGGFYSAEDADSEGEEGKFYVWKTDELREIFLKDVAFIEQHFSVFDNGNFKDEATRQKTGQNILHLNEVFALEDQQIWKDVRKQLFQERCKRTRPLLDDKILTDWNALIIAAFAKAAAVYQNHSYTDIAVKAYQFIKNSLIIGNTLFHRYKDGETAISGFSNDYLNLVWAGLELYFVTYDPQYLLDANTYLDEAINKFWDDKNGGFYLSNNHSDQPLGFQKELFDGAIPSANSIGFYCLLKLARITGNTMYEEKATQLGECFSTDLIRSGSSITMSMIALQFLNHSTGEIIVASGEDDTEGLKKFLQTEFLPSKIILWKNKSQKLSEILNYLSSQNTKDGNTQIYVCEHYSCDRPIDTLQDLIIKLTPKNRH
jgi:uncharacterized protein YyaL (SSP411 family)